MSIRHYLRLSAVSAIALLAGGGIAVAFPLSPLVITGSSGSVDLLGYTGLENFGSIVDDDASAAVWSDQDLTLIDNHAGALISSDGTGLNFDGAAIVVNGNLDRFVNDGTIVGSQSDIFVLGDVGTFTNTGTIRQVDNGGSGYGIDIAGSVGTFINAAGASISSDGEAIGFDSDVGTFTNAGSIMGGLDGLPLGVEFDGTLDSFTNTATGTISAGGGLAGVVFANAVGSFDNAGQIGGDTVSLGVLIGNLNDFLTPSPGLSAASVTDFTNSGQLSGVSAGLGTVEASVDNLTNTSTGTFSGDEAGFLAIASSIGTFTNAGTIRSSEGPAVGLLLGTNIDRFVNTASGRLIGPAGGLTTDEESRVGSLVNEGYIGGGDFAVALSQHGVDISNSGTIEGDTGVLIDGKQWGHSNIVNSGTIRGTAGTAIDFSSVCTCNSPVKRRNDTLTLLTGSKIFGAVNFGRGNDTLDFSGFAGNTVLDVPGLNKVVAGSRNYLWDHDADQVAIYDLGAFGSSTIGNSFSQISQAIAEQGWSEMGDWSDLTSDAAAPLNFAPDKPRTPAEQAVTDAGTQPGPAPHGWASVIGGGSVDYTPNEASTLYGGLVAGSHARLSATVDLGGLGGIVQSSNSTLGGDETLDTTTGVAGLYGQAQFGVADLDFALTGGASLHQSFRKVVAGGTTETATASFGSAFAAPSATVSIPVLANDGTSLALVGGGSYVGGLVSGYSETGSAMNLSVGAQTIGVIDARLGLEARQLIADTAGGTYALTAKAGVFANDNFGSSSVPVTLWGVSQTVATPGSTAYGAYGGFGVEAAMAGTIHISAHMDGSARTDGVVTASAKAGIGGAF